MQDNIDAGVYAVNNNQEQSHIKGSSRNVSGSIMKGAENGNKQSTSFKKVQVFGS